MSGHDTLSAELGYVFCMIPTADVAGFLRHLSSDPAESFAETFLVGDRNGAHPVSRDRFLQALPGRAAIFAQAGIGTPELAETDVTILDDHYLLVRTQWVAPRAHGEPVQLASSYLLHHDGNALRVVAYLNHKGPSDVEDA
jgi:hypothetical protein